MLSLLTSEEHVRLWHSVLNRASTGGREALVLLIETCIDAGRPVDTVAALQLLVRDGPHLTQRERHLLVAGCRTAIDPIITVVNLPTSSRQGRGHDVCMSMMMRYVEGQRAAGRDLMRQLLAIADAGVPCASDDDERVFFMKIRADALSRLALILPTDSPERRAAAVAARQAYKDAAGEAARTLSVLGTTRLGLAYNQSHFYDTVMQWHTMARRIRKRAFDDAMTQLDELESGGEDYKEVTLVLQMMRDPLRLWGDESPDESEEEAASASECKPEGPPR